MDDLILALLVGLAIAAIRIRDLLGAIAVLGAHSLVVAILWCRMDAVDVAFTEAAVGAGISTVLMLAAVARVGRHVRPHPLLHAGTVPKGVTRAGALLAVGVTAAGLLYAVPDMPVVGDPDAPATTHPLVKRWYVEVSPDAPLADAPAAGCATWWVEVEGLTGTPALTASFEQGDLSSPLGTIHLGRDGRGRLDRDHCLENWRPYAESPQADVSLVLRDAGDRVVFRGSLPEARTANQGEKDVVEGESVLAFIGEAPAAGLAPRARLGFRERGRAGEVGPANIVTSVLGDYRGYDTLGETVVIFTAGLCVVILLREAQSSRRRKEDDHDEEGGAA